MGCTRSTTPVPLTTYFLDILLDRQVHHDFNPCGIHNPKINVHPTTIQKNPIHKILASMPCLYYVSDQD